MSEQHRYEMSARWVRERVVKVSIIGKHDFEVATPIDFWPQAPTDVLSPEDLFVASVVTCYGVSLSGIANRFHTQFKDFTLHGLGTLKQAERGWEFDRILIQVSIDVSSDDEKNTMTKVAERAHTHCLVANSLKCPVLVETEINVKR
jgi:organic hydroperoxide reductase OsmC/OhrA